MEFKIKSRWDSKKIIYQGNHKNIIETLLKAVESDADLRGADLGNADLRGASLRGADLRGADLRGADLGNADLRGASLRGADLGNADLRGADLGNADLRGADLGNADLRGADLRGADLRGADLGGIKNYTDGYCHEIILELIRRLPREEIKKSEWEIIGKFSLYKPCWDEVIKYAKKPLLRILKILSDQGYTEYLDVYKKRTK